MKCRKTTVQNIANLWEKYLSARFPAILADIKSNPDKAPTSATLWTLWHHITDEIRSGIDHPRFNDRARVFKQNWNFPLYPDDTKDATLETGLRAAYMILAKGQASADKALNRFD